MTPPCAAVPSITTLSWFLSLTVLVHYKGEEAASKTDQHQLLLLANSVLQFLLFSQRKLRVQASVLEYLKAELISLLFIKLVWYFPLKYLFQLILPSDNFPWKNIKMKVGFVIAENEVGKKKSVLFYCIFVCSLNCYAFYLLFKKRFSRWPMLKKPVYLPFRKGLLGSGHRAALNCILHTLGRHFQVKFNFAQSPPALNSELWEAPQCSLHLQARGSAGPSACLDWGWYFGTQERGTAGLVWNCTKPSVSSSSTLSSQGM